MACRTTRKRLTGRLGNGSPDDSETGYLAHAAALLAQRQQGQRTKRLLSREGGGGGGERTRTRGDTDMLHVILLVICGFCGWGGKTRTRGDTE